MRKGKGSEQTCQALMFDVFGTLVDWRGSVSTQLRVFFSQSATLKAKGPGSGSGSDPGFGSNCDWDAFALDWRALYQPSMQTVRDGGREFVVLDTLHRESLIATLQQHNIKGLNNAQIDQLVLFWHTLDAWPDVSNAMHALRSQFTLAAVSNGNTDLLKSLAQHADLPWHVSLGAEPCQAYKPQAKAYLYSAQMLALDPAQCMMVAAHNDDLRAAHKLGFKTAYINRPTEYGTRQTRDTGPESDWDYSAGNLAELAAKLLGNETDND